MRRSLPLALQAACHQTVFRFHGTVLTLRSCHGVLGSLKPLLPVLMQRVPLRFHIGGHLETHLER